MDLKVGDTYLATVTSNVPGVPVPPGAVVATSSDPAVVQVGLPGNDSNILAVRAVGVGPFVITYSCPGFTPVTESGTVSVQPALVVTDGPVTR